MDTVDVTPTRERARTTLIIKEVYSRHSHTFAYWRYNNLYFLLNYEKSNSH